MAGLQKIRELTIDTMISRNFSQNEADLKTYYFYQGDINSAKFLLNITHEGAEQDLSTATKVQIAFLKPDGKRVFQDCSNVNPTKGKYYVVLNTQSITTVGNVVAQIRITFPDTVVETTKFVFSVEESIMSDEAIESSDEFPAIQKAIEAGEKLEGVDIPALVASKETAEQAKVAAEQNSAQIGILSKSIDQIPQVVESNQMQINSAVSKQVLRRKGYFDKTPSVPNKRAMIVGVPDTDGYYFVYHDLISRGIPFHICTYTSFVANYNSQTWKDKYDIMIFCGVYSDFDTTTPTDVKTAVLDIKSKNTYKMIQVSYLGMQKASQTTAYWFADFGLDVWGSGEAKSTNFTSAETVVGDTANGDVVTEEKIYSVSGFCGNAFGTGLTRLAYASTTTTHWFASINANKTLAFIGNQSGTVNGFNSAIDFGKLIWHMRGVRSHVAFNRFNGKKYIAWGWDCDTTNDLDAIKRILELSGDRPVELSLVTSRISNEVAQFYRSIQSKNRKIVSHSVGHFKNIVPEYLEWVKSTDDLDALGFVNDGIHYLTGTITKPELWQYPLDAGYLLCGYVPGYEGRNATYLPFGEYTNSVLKTSFKLDRGCPIWSTTLLDDIANMGTNGENAYNKFVETVKKEDMYPYELPLVFYFHDSPSVESYNASNWAGTYYDKVNGMERRKQYYRDVFSYIDSLGYTQLMRSTATELLYDITNCVSVPSEVVTATNVTTKVVSSRHIKGLTIAIPVDSSKTIANIKIEGIAIDNTQWELSSDKKWVYVGIEAVAGKEHTVLVTYN